MSSFTKMAGLCLLILTSLALGQPTEEGRLLRFPDIHQDKIAFMYGGDLWLASSAGGMARRITTHPGRELFPKFFPTANGLHSQVSTTATSMFMLCPPKAGNLGNSPSIRERPSLCGSAWESTIKW